MTFATILKRFFQLLVLGALCYLAWIIYRDSQEAPETISNEPQMILSSYEIKRYTPQGILEYTLIGAALQHYDNEKGSTLTDPRLFHYDITRTENSPPLRKEHPYDWRAESDIALISQDRNLITMINNVELFLPDTQEPVNDLTLNTEKLYIHDQGERATSELFVKITTPTRLLTGIGLDAYPPKKMFTLLDDVHSTFLMNQESDHESTPQ
ncbi:LPS export ABC transporter periplasmic protein LptC [Ignatzschineria larvae DSM 13226]|uniref:LPS export ABC transporter periplasmic protein LptC n=1 Tax=Ignatzschineria larvae DSM 13226 TaxID=1111732 RepID=A0ABZ3C3I2_9GAMM|nr:LPS export ABC transporter periplasmic protein LptC [Ignatzschineria larvae]